MSSSCVSAGRTGTCVFNALTHLLVQRSGTACSEGRAAYELQLDVQSTREGGKGWHLARSQQETLALLLFYPPLPIILKPSHSFSNCLIS